MKEQLYRIMCLCMEIQDTTHFEAHFGYAGNIDGLEVNIKDKRTKEWLVMETVYLDKEEHEKQVSNIEKGLHHFTKDTYNPRNYTVYHGKTTTLQPI